MGLSRLNLTYTKWTSSALLLKRAYTPQKMTAMVAQTPFQTCDIALDGVGFTVRLQKPVI